MKHTTYRMRRILLAILIIIFACLTTVASAKSSNQEEAEKAAKVVKEFFNKYYASAFGFENDDFETWVAYSNETADVIERRNLLKAFYVDVEFDDLTVKCTKLRYKVKGNLIQIVGTVRYEVSGNKKLSGGPTFGVILQAVDGQYKITKLLLQRDGEPNISYKQLNKAEDRTVFQIQDEYKNRADEITRKNKDR